MKDSSVPLHDYILADATQLNVPDALARALVDLVKTISKFHAHFDH